MPMFAFDFNRSVANLDLTAARSGVFTPGITTLELDTAKLDRFNALVQCVAPGQPAYAADQIAGAARRVLRAAMKGQESAFIKVRMRRAGEMRAALADPQWDIAPELEVPMREIVTYVDDDAQTLIPNHIPVVGLLDDAILVDAAMDRLRGELDDYADFCRYRYAESSRLGVAFTDPGITREHWYQDRQQELRLEQQLRRVRGTNYSGKAAKADGFRIC